jgi:ABC-type bacteriocin/lantibiotic exporters, contain an N-terminal double-glycine peptidase domain
MNIFTTYLRLLKVKHTKSFSGRFFNEHPNKYDLFGLSSMLTDYGIENKGLRLDNKQNKLPLLNAPFIAHAGNDFVIVTKNTPKKIDYIWRDKKISVKVDEFIKTWSGIVLLTESNENSGEPDYLLHRKNEYFKKSAQYLLLFLSFLCVGMIYVSQQLFLNPGLSLSLFINIIGIYVCYLLLLKQMKIEGTYADKICSLLKQGDCNNILESDSAKLFGLIGWSEIGFGYFISNIIFILFFPELIALLAIINISALPFTVWSVLYQKKVKQWCTLCLIVQGLLWGIFVVNLCAGFIALPLFDIINLIWAGCIYSIPLLCIVLLAPKFSESTQIEDVKQELNSFKANEDFFHTLIKKQPHFHTNKEDSAILFGNPESKSRITILTNPHCTPCAKMHEKINRLLIETNSRFCIQYIFTSFSEELEISSRFLISIYHEYPNQAMQIFNEWFEGGKNKKEEMFSKYNFNRDKFIQEFMLHKAWREKYKLITTPVVLVNGYRLPESYKIEDLRFITNFL